MKTLIKLPTRERRNKFEFVMEMCLVNITKPEDVDFLLTLDSDDSTMSVDSIKEKCKLYSDFLGKKIYLDYGDSQNKVDAINRGIDLYPNNWDILLLISDDMICNYKGFDEKISKDMETYFPDTDGVLWYPDGYRDDLNTLPILGKKYYDRFNYIYNPIYESVFCDDEFMRVARLLNRHADLKENLFIHDHPVWTGQGMDELYKKNDEPYRRDEIIFKNRLESNFGVTI